MIFEGFLSAMALGGTFLVSKLRNENLPSFRMLLLGLFLLSIAMMTDTLDEILDISYLFSLIFEGLFQVMGFIILLLGLNRWLTWNDLQNTELEKMATTDYLTGTVNRRHFMEILETQKAQIERHQYALSLILFDIDHFKSINDQYGHDVGDAVLKQIADTVRKNIRQTDVFARYGGEEFIVLAPYTDMPNAHQVAENIRVALQKIENENVQGITASFGVAQYNNGESTSNLIRRVDEAMFKAKNAGRNQISSSGISLVR